MTFDTQKMEAAVALHDPNAHYKPSGVIESPKFTVAGFSGTRDGMTAWQCDNLLTELKILGIEELHHGDCIGADQQAFLIASFLEIKTVAHPPSSPLLRAFTNSNEVLPKKPYLERNRDIVDASECLIVGAKQDYPQERGGTWYTYRYAQNMGKMCSVLLRQEEGQSDGTGE